MSDPLSDVLHYGTVTIPFTTAFSDRATLEIGVEPDGRVLVKAPTGTPYVRVRQRVASRARWIDQQRTAFAALAQPASRVYVSGETHRYLGCQYRLRVEHAARSAVTLSGSYLVVRTPGGSPERTARALDRWYRARASVKFSERVALHLPRFAPYGVLAPDVRLRRMSSRWGSRTASGRIYLNPALVRAPVACVDYVVVHELSHAVHSHHGTAFYALLDVILPDWRCRKARLNATRW